MLINFKRNKGAATLILTVILMFISTMIVIFATSINTQRIKISANQLRKNEAFEAALAGLAYGIQYLQANSTSIIVPNASTGLIPNYTNALVTNVLLDNNAHYTIVYSNPTPFDYTVIKVASTGLSQDGTASKTVQRLVRVNSSFTAPPTFSLITLGSINLTGNAKVVNQEANKTIRSAGGVAMSGNAGTITASGGSSSSQMGADIVKNDASLAGMDATGLFQSFFNSTPAAYKSSASYQLTSATSSSAAGLSNTTIYIEGNASYASTTQIGTAAAPVVLYVNGSLSLSGNTKVYGMIFVNGSLATSGNAQVYGAIANTSISNVDSDLVITSSGNTVLNYNSSILSNVQSIPALKAVNAIPGSWKDF